MQKGKVNPKRPHGNFHQTISIWLNVEGNLQWNYDYFLIMAPITFTFITNDLNSPGKDYHYLIYQCLITQIQLLDCFWKPTKTILLVAHNNQQEEEDNQ